VASDLVVIRSAMLVLDLVAQGLVVLFLGWLVR